MAWGPMPEKALREEIDAAWERMTIPQRRFWQFIRIEPEKWQQHPYGDQGGGFWAVALLGRLVVWYNDIEEGFNFSKYARYGEIEEYWCNQDELEHTIQFMMDILRSGESRGYHCGPPEAVQRSSQG